MHTDLFVELYWLIVHLHHNMHRPPSQATKAGTKDTHLQQHHPSGQRWYGKSTYKRQKQAPMHGMQGFATNKVSQPPTNPWDTPSAVALSIEVTLIRDTSSARSGNRHWLGYHLL